MIGPWSDLGLKRVTVTPDEVWSSQKQVKPSLDLGRQSDFSTSSWIGKCKTCFTTETLISNEIKFAVSRRAIQSEINHSQYLALWGLCTADLNLHQLIYFVWFGQYSKNTVHSTGLFDGLTLM
jgi:hypothetical protein